MIKLPASLQFQNVPRVAAYATLALGITAALFAADAAYRWSHDIRSQVARSQVAAPLPEPKPAPVAAAVSAAPAQAATEAPDQAAAEIRSPAEPQSVTVQAPSPSNGQAPAIASGPVSEPAVGAIPGGSASTVANIAAPEATRGPDDSAPRLAQPSPRIKRQQARKNPEKQATRERAAPRRPVQASSKPPARAEKPQTPKPDVYWERDSQLGFAPQLRKRTCNPATGQMPMQCYYPREGREKFPAKSVN